MKSWVKFFIIPFVSYVLINLAVYLISQIPYEPNSLFKILAFIVLFIFASIPPYLMLRLAPKAPYFSTVLYISLFAIANLSAKLQIDSPIIENLNFAFVGFFVVTTLFAIGYYFFFKDPRFKVSYS